MAKNIHLRLTGQAEKLLHEVGLSERDAIAKALWLLNLARTKRLAIIKPETVGKELPEVESVLTLPTLGGLDFEVR
jgi:hypothetical protein